VTQELLYIMVLNLSTTFFIFFIIFFISSPHSGFDTPLFLSHPPASEYNSAFDPAVLDTRYFPGSKSQDPALS